MIKLIAFDLDGTALNDNKEMTKETVLALTEAVEKGYILLPATGRTYSGIPDFVKTLPGVDYIVATNGGGIYDAKTDECVYLDGIEPKEYTDALDELLKIDVMPDIFMNGKAYMDTTKAHLIDKLDLLEGMKKYIHDTRIIVDNLTEHVSNLGDGIIEKITINIPGKGEEKMRLYDEVWKTMKNYPNLNSVDGGTDNVEVTKKGVSKESALIWIANKYNISLEEMISFGDSGNDESMLLATGVSVAMGNGADIAKAAATFVADDNNNDGMAKYIRENLLK